MAERTFADLDILIAEIKEIKDEYANMLQQHPVPWSNIIKVSFRARLQVLRESLTNWDEYVNKIQSKIKTMKNDDDEKQKLIDKIDDWKREPKNRALKREVSMIILEGQGYLQLDTAIPKPTSEPSNTTPHLSIPNVNIPKFNGDYLKWRSFRQRFEYSIHLKSYPKVEKMIALLGLLEGAALAEVQGFEVSDENYDSVLELLEERFGNSHILIQQLQTKLRNLPPAKEEAQSIRDTVNMVTNMVRQLQNLKVDTNNKATVLDIIEKMPKNERIELRYASMTSDITLDQILQKLKQLALKAEIAAEDEKEHDEVQKGYTTKPLYESSISNEDQKHNSYKKFVCSLCEDNHLPSDCSKFPSVEEKIKQLKLKNGCTNCARRNHVSNQCRANAHCNNCSGNHYTFLCQPKNNFNLEKTYQTNAMVSVGVQQGCLLTKRITVINPVTKEAVDATIFFDSGSQKSYISDQLIHQLKLPRVAKEHLHLQGIGARASNFMSSLIKLQIKTGENYEEIFANSIRKIADSVPIMSYNGNDDPKSFKVSNHPPDILIGMDYFFQFISSFEKRNGFVIVHSKIGQMLSSNIPQFPKETISAFAIDSNKHYNHDDKTPKYLKTSARGNTWKTSTSHQNLERFKTNNTNQYKAKTQKETGPRTFKSQKPKLSSSVQSTLLTPKVILNQSEKTVSESSTSITPVIIEKQLPCEVDTDQCHGQCSSTCSSKKNKRNNAKFDPSRKHQTIIKRDTVTHQKNETKAPKLGGGEGLKEEPHKYKKITFWRSNWCRHLKAKEDDATSYAGKHSAEIKSKNELLKGWVKINQCSSKELYAKFTPHAKGSNVDDSKD